MSLILGVLTNNWGKLAIGLSFAGLLLILFGTQEVAQRYKADAQEAKAELAARLEEDQFQEAKNEQIAKDHQQQDAQIAAQLQSALAAAHITGNALTASVLKYESTHRCSLPERASAPATPGHLGGGPGAAGDRLDQSLAQIPADAQLVVDQLRACQTALRGMSSHGNTR